MHEKKTVALSNFNLEQSGGSGSSWSIAAGWGQALHAVPSSRRSTLCAKACTQGAFGLEAPPDPPSHHAGTLMDCPRRAARCSPSQTGSSTSRCGCPRSVPCLAFRRHRCLQSAMLCRLLPPGTTPARPCTAGQRCGSGSECQVSARVCQCAHLPHQQCVHQQRRGELHFQR